MKRTFIQPMIAGIAAAIVLVGACVEFYHVAWGTGEAVGQFSPKWLLFFLLFVLFCGFIFAAVFLALFRQETFLTISQRLVLLRDKFTLVSWLLAVVVLFLPVWFLQQTMWGIVFDGGNFRALLWALTVFLLSILIATRGKLLDWRSFLASLVLTSSAFTIAVSLQGVTDYPFSLGWSEGNRIWDYSILFGRERYNIAADQDIFVLLDPGRMFVGGIPFLIPGVTIDLVRLWIGLTLVVPYFLVGLAAYIAADKNFRLWLLMTLWVFLFLRQGPIHTPLVLAAALTIFLWRKPLWLAIPLMIYAGYFAQSSRYTWLFAPGIWIGMLELAGASLRDGKVDRAHWVRAISLGFAGVFGGYLLPKLMPLLNRPAESSQTVTDLGEQIANSGVSSEFVAQQVSDQPLLWYRLLPNPTYGTGILLGLLIAVLPVIVLLVWLSANRKWQTNIWQKLAILGPLTAFLVVGLIISTKIGGGGDLHNMDMFLIGLAFTALIAWVNGGREALLEGVMPLWVRLTFVAALIIPAVTPWRQLRANDYGDEISSLMTLTDTSDKRMFDMLPDTVTIDSALQEIQVAVDDAGQYGDILFIDQRQLLTFGFIKGVTLFPEYEKKVLMNEALSGNMEYFSRFYSDISSQRFSLIISEPLRTPVKDSSYEFGEENNAWVSWVSIPVLCYYQEIQTFKEVNVMLLVPKPVPDDCSEFMPKEN